MVRKMLKYLTTRYKCRETDEPNMTPVEFADVLGASEAAHVLREAIVELEKNIKSIEAAQVGGGAKSSKNFLQNIMKKDDYEARGTQAPDEVMINKRSPIISKEEVTAERTIQAKARLQAFQEQRKKK